MEFVFNIKNLFKKSTQAFLILFLLLSPSVFAERLSGPFDHSVFDDFLKAVVNEKGDVNYQLARENRALLDQYVGYFESSKFDTKDFSDHWPREERLATALNLYHAGVIRLVLDYYPIRSIQDIPGGWDLTVVRFGGKQMWSLNDIRQNEIIGKFRDEKIHTAIACGSKGCPPFPREAYTGPKVEGQLYEASIDFVNDLEFNEIIPEDKRVKISKIFKWYGKDFRLDFGFAEENKFSSNENAVLAFLTYYIQDPEKIEFLESRRYKIKYQHFDWSLREWGNHLQTT
jgi:hypothetical protein